MKNLTTIAAASLAVMMMTGGVEAKKWTVETVNVKDGKATVIGAHQTTCNYREAMKMARDFQDDAEGNYVRTYSEDDAVACPKVARKPKSGDVATSEAKQ